MRLRLTSAGVLLGAAVVLALTRTIASGAIDDLGRTRPCPPSGRSIPASEVHFAPGLVAHQSWVEFSTPRRFAGYFALCLDGRLLSGGGGEFEFQTGRARFSVSTTWVDLQWLAGSIDAYRDGQRWELRLYDQNPGDGLSTHAQLPRNSFAGDAA